MRSQSNLSETSMATANGDDPKKDAGLSINTDLTSSNTASTLSATNGGGDVDGGSEVPLTRYERIYNRYVLLFLMCFTQFFLFFDRGAMTSLITDIRNDKEIAGGDHKSLTETEGSFVVSSYMIGFVISGPICSALGRIVNARYIMSVGLVVTLASSFMTGLANSFVTLVIIRAASGFGEAAIGSYFMTMIDNTSSPKTRTMWIGFYSLAVPLGMALGTAASGYIASQMHGIGGRASWRLAFFSAAIGGAPFAIGTMLYPSRFSPTSVGVKMADQEGGSPSSPTNGDDHDPLLVHGASPPASPSGKSTAEPSNFDHASPLDAIKRLATNKLYMALISGMGAFILIAGGNSILTQPMLRFGPWKLGQAEASMLSAVIAVPSVLGSIVGGIVLDRFGGSAGRRGLFRCCRHMVMAAIFSAPILVGSLFVYNVGGYLTMQVVALSVFMTVVAPSTAAILSSVDKDCRTYAMSYAVIFERLIALPGPTIIGQLADHYSEGCHHLNFQHMCEGTAEPTPSDDNVTTADDTTTCDASFFQFALGGDSITTMTAENFTTMAPETTTTTATPNNNGNSTPTDRSEQCVWVPGKTGSNGSCMNEFEARNAVATFSGGYIIPILGWLIATIIAYKKSLQNMAAHAAAEEEEARRRESAVEEAS